jgi:RNA polymerase sigma-70 factor (ECF subfamily)
VEESLLIRRLKRGKEDAYVQVVHDCGNRLLKTCCLMLGSREEAEDVVQETFIKVFENIGQFKGNSSLYTWIYTIALNLSRDRLKRKRNVLSFQDDLDEWNEDDNVESHVEKSIDREVLKKELFKLHPMYMEVMTLFYFEELSIKEISALLNEKEGTVKSRLSRGRNILKENLTKGGL